MERGEGGEGAAGGGCAGRQSVPLPPSDSDPPSLLLLSLTTPAGCNNNEKKGRGIMFLRSSHLGETTGPTSSLHFFAKKSECTRNFVSSLAVVTHLLPRLKVQLYRVVAAVERVVQGSLKE